MKINNWLVNTSVFSITAWITCCYLRLQTLTYTEQLIFYIKEHCVTLYNLDIFDILIES